MDLYQRRFLKIPIHKEYCKAFKDGETVKDFIFRGYHGGRTEVFKRGSSIKKQLQHKKKTIWYYYDFNSMYAEAMRGEYPIPSSARIKSDTLGRIKEDLVKQYMGVTECEVIHPNIYYPILPIFIKDKLCFPIGKFRGVFTNTELQKFLSIGGKITKIYKIIYYTKTFKPFEKWVNTLYGLRLKYIKEGNKIYSIVIKNILVNLYGNFGTNKLKDFEMIDPLNIPKDTTNIQPDDQLGIWYRETLIECNQAYIMPIFACETTAKGRIKLYNTLVELNGIYCDTDSIFTDQYIESSYDLGDLKLEKVCDSVNFVKPKHYMLLEKEQTKAIIKIKGLRLYNEDIKRRLQFEKSISSKDIKQIKFVKMKESLRSKFLPNEKVSFTKRMSLIDNKRLWISPYDRNDFQDSKPILLGYETEEELEKEINC